MYISYFFSQVISLHVFNYIQESGDIQGFVQKVLRRGNEADARELLEEYCGGFNYAGFRKAMGCD